MTISRSELRRSVVYDDLTSSSRSYAEPDTVSAVIETAAEDDLVEIICNSNGLKEIQIGDLASLQYEVDLASETFASWSPGLKTKVAEALTDLADWEAKLRRSGGVWDARLLADPNLSLEDL
ncbi:MAG: hypothetical protein P8J20_02270 [Novosphingobium sp.]|nr:hypothetical protein [Novosphingobium sp.]